MKKEIKNALENNNEVNTNTEIKTVPSLLAFSKMSRKELNNWIKENDISFVNATILRTKIKNFKSSKREKTFKKLVDEIRSIETYLAEAKKDGRIVESSVLTAFKKIFKLNIKRIIRYIYVDKTIEPTVEVELLVEDYSHKLNITVEGFIDIINKERASK